MPSWDNNRNSPVGFRSSGRWTVYVSAVEASMEWQCGPEKELRSRCILCGESEAETRMKPDAITQEEEI